MQPFDFQGRTRLVFGEGCASSLGEAARALGGRRALLVTDPGVAAAGHASRAEETLRSAGVEVRVFDGVVENPTDRCVERGLHAAREVGADVLAAVGGGSSMDCAKAVGLLHACGGRLEDYRGVGKVPRPLPPLVAVPTTAGTGSEVQSAALISREAGGDKMLLWDRKLCPPAALLDPLLTLSQPRAVTAVTGIDALAHAVESFVSTRATAISRSFASSASRLLFRAFQGVVADPTDLEARSSMLLGACFAGLSIEHSMLGAAHACANPLTARYGIVHGTAVSLVLPHVVRYNGRERATEDAYFELGVSAGLRPAPAGPSGEVASAAEALAARLEILAAAAGIPRTLRECGVEENRLPDLAEEAAGQWTAGFNPRPVRAFDLLEIYRCAF